MEKTIGGIKVKFSVLIPVYNTEKYLKECIQSVLNQSYKDYEIILVDDGSTDSSPQICDDYQNKYPDIIKVIHQTNSGQLISRVNAICTSNGDYCIFLDSDDLIVENALEILFQKIETHKTPDMVIYPFYYDREGKLEKSKTISSSEHFYSEEDIRVLHELFFTGVLLNSMCTKCVKRTVLLKCTDGVRSYSSLRCSEDRLQSMWVLDNITNALYIDTALYRYRLFSGSTTRTYTYSDIAKFNTSILYEEEEKYLKKWGFISFQWEQRFQAKYISYMIYVFDLFYLNVPKNEQKSVIDYPWNSFIPKAIDLSKIDENPFLNDIKKELARWIIDENRYRIKRFYMKKRTYQLLRSIKRKVIK